MVFMWLFVAVGGAVAAGDVDVAAVAVSVAAIVAAVFVVRRRSRCRRHHRRLWI